MKTTTVVDHELRKRLDLTCIEYCVCDYFSTDEPYQTRQALANHFNLTKKNFMLVTKRLIKYGYLKKGTRRGELFCTEAWEKNFFNNTPIKEPKSTTFVAWVPSDALKKGEEGTGKKHATTQS